jgi:hypothetical protein
MKQARQHVSELFNEPDSGRYSILVLWPDGQRTVFEGIGLTAEQVVTGLEECAGELRVALAEAAKETA